MAKLLVIGCGGVAQVAIQKCCQNDGLFTELVLASRTKAKCDALKEKLAGKTKTVISTAEVDADNVAALCVLIRDVRPDAVLTLSAETRELAGGLILKQGDIEVNCSVDTLLELSRGELAARVAEVLFEG